MCVRVRTRCVSLPACVLCQCMLCVMLCMLCLVFVAALSLPHPLHAPARRSVLRSGSAQPSQPGPGSVRPARCPTTTTTSTVYVYRAPRSRAQGVTPSPRRQPPAVQLYASTVVCTHLSPERTFPAIWSQHPLQCLGREACPALCPARVPCALPCVFERLRGTTVRIGGWATPTIDGGTTWLMVAAGR